jgi:hypothetical protein
MPLSSRLLHQTTHPASTSPKAIPPPLPSETTKNGKMEVNCPNCGSEGRLPGGIAPPAWIRCRRCKAKFAGPARESVGTTESEPPLPIESSNVTLTGRFSLVAGLSSMVIGAAAIALCWTVFAGWSIPLALIALVVGTVAVLLDWFRDVARFSTSVPGVATGTVALCVAFVQQGGLDFTRYKPIHITTIVTKEVVREVAPQVPKLPSDTEESAPRTKLSEEVPRKTPTPTTATEPSAAPTVKHGFDYEKGRLVYRRGDGIDVFLEKLADVLQNEPRSFGEYPVSMTYDKAAFLRVFGDPYSDVGRTDVERTWTYRCRDGVLSLRVIDYTDRVVVEDVAYSHRENTISSQMSIKDVEAVLMSKVPDNLKKSTLSVSGMMSHRPYAADWFFDTFGYPNGLKTLGTTGQKYYVYQCADGIVGLEVQETYGRVTPKRVKVHSITIKSFDRR